MKITTKVKSKQVSVSSNQKNKTSKRQNINQYIFINTMRYLSDVIDKDFMSLQKSYTCKFNKLYTFYYDPLYRDTLTYYDIMPLILLTKKENNGFYGLNFHFLLNKFKKDLFIGISKYDFKGNQRIWTSFNIPLLISYSKNSKYSFLTRHYLFNRMRTKFIEIPTEYYETVFMNYLPNTFEINQEKYDRYKKNKKKRIRNKMKTNVYRQLFIEQNNLDKIMSYNTRINIKNDVYMKIK